MAKSGSSSTDWGGIGKGISAGASIFSGVSSYLSSLEAASLLDEQGALSKADYFRQASLTRDEGSRVRAKQAMEYISAGVELVGTPQLVMRETMAKADAEARAYETTGRNTESLYNKKASITRSEGMSQLISSVLNAGAMAMGA